MRSSPTPSGTPPVRRRSRRRSTATGRRSTRSSGPWPEHKHGWLSRILGDSEAITEEVTELLTAWLPLYQEIEPRVATIIERDVALRANDRSRLGPAELIERTTNGIRWLSEPGVRRVVLAPSYLARPYNFTFAGGDWRMFVYPVSDAALEPTDPLAPPVGVLRLHRALGDDTRLRILRLLRDRDWYLTEIAERLELSQADDQAPPRAAPGRRPGDADRGGRPLLLQPAPRPARRRVDRAQALPDLDPTEYMSPFDATPS